MWQNLKSVKSNQNDGKTCGGMMNDDIAALADYRAAYSVYLLHGYSSILYAKCFLHRFFPSTSPYIDHGKDL